MAVAPKIGSRRRGILVVLVSLMAVALWVSSASATVMKYADMAQLVEISDVIVQGRVVDQNTYFDEAYGDVVTDTTIQVEHTFLGEPAETVTLQQWGGEYDGKVAFVPGDAKFQPYEEVIVFMARGKNADDGKLFLSALSQSKFTLMRSGDETHVLRDMHDLAFLVETPAGSKMQKRTDERTEYEAFVAELKTLVQGIKGGSQ